MNLIFMAKLTVKKIIVLLLVVATSSVWLLPQKASAAFDDVQFTGPITVYIANSALNLTVLSGSVATTTVSAGNVIFYMNAGSNVLITSSNRKILTNDLGVNTVCTASESQLYLTATADKTVTVSIGGDCPSAGIVGDGGGGGGGTITLDTTAPTVSAVSSQVGSIEAQITWNTNEASLSWVLYGTTTSYGKESLGTTYITSHSAKLTSLNASTTYHYQLKTKDSSGNIGNTSDYTFTTLLSGSLPISTTTITTATTTVTTATTTVSPTPSPTTEIQLSTKPISQMTKVEIQAEITKIIALIAQLQQELSKMIANE